jgi:hypothetical protein
MSDEVTDLTRGVYRRLYSGFTKGQRINKLSLNAEAWFWRILATVDDFGNGDADPDLCRDATAGKRKVTAKQVSDWVEEMRSVELIRFYKAKGELYLHVTGFEVTQPAGKNGRRIRRYPCPDESEVIQGIPDAVSASDNEDDNDSENENDNEMVGSRAKPRSPRTVKKCDEEYLEELQNSAAYRRLDVRHVHAKMAVWCQNKGKQPTRGRLINWLNNEDQPLEFKAAKTPANSTPIDLPPRPEGVSRWACACGFHVLQNGNRIKDCPECGKGLTRDAVARVSA